MRVWRTLAFLLFGLCVIIGIVKTAKGANTTRTGDWTDLDLIPNDVKVEATVFKTTASISS